MRSLILSFVLFCCSSRAEVINVACTYPAITNALFTTAQEGDTVLIGAGDCIISNRITINRNISFTIAGSGTNETTLRSPADTTMLWYFSSSTNLVTIRDLNIVGASPNTSGCLLIGANTLDFKGFFHIYNIKMTNVVGRGISAGAGLSRNAYGLVDNCHMKAALSGYAQMFSPEGSFYGAWTNSNPLGTTNVWCIEDCYLETTTNNAGNGFFDSYNGAQLVFRHNLCNGYSPIGGHGYDSGPVSVRTFEIYSNVFSNWSSSLLFSGWRGGTGVMFSNAVYGASVTLFSGLEYYRACPYSHAYAGSDTGYLSTGQPGVSYTVNFAGITNYQTGCGRTLSGNPTNGQSIGLGFTLYYFVSALTNATFAMANFGGNGGGAVLIGNTVAETCTNLYNAINIGPGYGTTRTNWGGIAFRVGHDFVAMGLDTTNLYLTNALDGNTDQYGYPANQQQGVLTSYPLTTNTFVNNQALFPCYGWSNTVNGVNIPTFSAPSSITNCNYNLTNLVKLGRDYFNDVIPSPETYTPLTYPHPLSVNYVNPTRFGISGRVSFGGKITQ